jgi:hypothetical protein
MTLRLNWELGLIGFAFRPTPHSQPKNRENWLCLARMMTPSRPGFLGRPAAS